MPGRKNIVQNLVQQGYALADNSESDDYSDLTILIGTDQMFKFVKFDKIDENLFSIPSEFGLLISGTILNKSDNNTVTTVLHVGCSEEFCDSGDEIR